MGYVLEIPSKGSTDKMINKVSKIIKKLEIDNIVFSNELIYTEFSFRVIDNLDKETVCDGRKLMIYMQYDILIYILNIQNIDISNADVYFLIKKDNDLNLQFLSKFIENCKWEDILFTTTLGIKAKSILEVSNNDYFYRRDISRGVSSINYQANDKIFDIFKITDGIMNSVYFIQKKKYQEPLYMICFAAIFKRIEELEYWNISKQKIEEIKKNNLSIGLPEIR